MLDPLPAATLKGLGAKLPPARVDQAVPVSARPAHGDGPPWGWIAFAAAFAGVAAIALRRRVPRLLRVARG